MSHLIDGPVKAVNIVYNIKATREYIVASSMLVRVRDG